MEQPNYYAVIPAEVRYDKDLKANEKLLYGEISVLSNKNGYCNASNAYFSDLYDKHKDTISEWICNLAKKNYIKTEIIKNSLGRVQERRIYLSAKTPIPPRQKHLYPIGENTEGNITSNNNINNNNKETENNFGKIIEFYENNITLITPYVSENIEAYLEDGLEAELIIECMKEAVSRNKRSFKYIDKILKDCRDNNIKTVKQYQIKQKEFKENMQKNNSREIKEAIYNTDFREYEELAKGD